MPATLLQANEFHNLFRGNTHSHTVFLPSGTFEANGKAEGVYKTVPGDITDQLILNHFNGSISLGVAPICPPNLCQFGVIDIDSHNETMLSAVRRVIYKRAFPLIPFRSKSGGLHLYLFLLEPTLASGVLNVLDQLRQVLGLPTETELFPKQRTIDKTSSGSCINLPYFNASAATRYAINEYGTAMSLDEALVACRKGRTLVTRVQDFIDALPVNDGPPCLQTMRIMGTPHLRNQYLFSFARYARAKSEEGWESEVIAANSELSDPLTLDELEATVLKSHRKKEYAYACSQEPLKSLCNRTLCIKRMFGVGSNDIPNLTFEELVQYKADPPYYEWKINGQVMRFFSEDDLLRQDVFRRQCMRSLHFVPRKLNDARWVEILNRAFGNIDVRDVDIAGDISPGSQFYTYLTEFLTKRTMAANRSQLLMGRVYLDPDINKYVFRAKDFLSFITSVKQFRTFTPAEIRTRLLDMHADTTRYYVDARNRGVRVWQLPKDSLGEQEDVTDVGPIDFLEELGEDF